MKCEGCLELLEEYHDGELAEREASEIAAHLITCAECSSIRATLAVEQEMFSRYDRELEVPALLWEQIAGQTVSPVSTPVSRNGFHALVASWFRVPSFGFSFNRERRFTQSESLLAPRLFWSRSAWVRKMAMASTANHSMVA